MTAREDAKHLTPTEHTPGPWTVDHDGYDADYVYVMANESTTTVAAMHPAFSSDPRGGMTMADARLIASAPALLAACEEMSELLLAISDSCDLLGEADVPPGHVSYLSKASLCSAVRKISERAAQGVSENRAAIAQARGSK